jgi:pyoverdine/dityrosine biosynthesis protein Dit1
MISIKQYQILNACADDEELFYFPFVEVNYGGQVFSKFLRTPQSNYSQYEDDREYTIKTVAVEIINDIVYLIGKGFLKCCRINDDESRTEIKEDVEVEEFLVYQDYDCLLYEDHIKKFGYAKHEFKISELGMKEIDKDIYSQYLQELGWE